MKVLKTMKTTITKTKYVLLAFLVALTFSCNPEDGADGADGATGPAGQDGNANVISSDWTEYDLATWTSVVSEFGFDYRNYPIAVSEITQDVVDNGLVLVYNRFVATGTQVYILPFTENITGMDPAGQILSFRFELNDLTLKLRNVSATGDPGTFGGSGIAEYRYIIVPSNSEKTTSVDYAKMSYDEVINHFNLDD